MENGSYGWMFWHRQLLHQAQLNCKLDVKTVAGIQLYLNLLPKGALLGGKPIFSYCQQMFRAVHHREAERITVTGMQRITMYIISNSIYRIRLYPKCQCQRIYEAERSLQIVPQVNLYLSSAPFWAKQQV